MKIIANLLSVLAVSAFMLPVNAAESDFPIHLEPEIRTRNHSVNFFFIDSFLTEQKISGTELRLEAKTHFLNEGSGIIAEISFQHLFGLNPAVIAALVPPGAAYMHDAHALAGYRFGFLEQFGLIPFLKARGIITRGAGGDNLYGPEAGAGLEWVIYPETAKFNLRYGVMVPVMHRYTGQSDIVAASSFLLNNLEANLSYRILSDWDVHVGYQLRAFPKNLGNSNLATADLINWHSIKFGAGFVF